jgi:hypothetical protein
VAAEASISPECCLAVHSPPELRHTKVYTPMPAGRWSSARAAAEGGRGGGGFANREAGGAKP